MVIPSVITFSIIWRRNRKPLFSLGAICSLWHFIGALFALVRQQGVSCGISANGRQGGVVDHAIMFLIGEIVKSLVESLLEE